MPYTVKIVGATGGDTVSKDKTLIVKNVTTWDPSTAYPGDNVAGEIGDGKSIDMSYPADSDHPSSFSAYFWVNSDKLNSYSLADYGCTVSLDANKTPTVNYFAPGNATPNGNNKTRYIAADFDNNDPTVGKLFVFNIKTVKVQNLTDGTIGYVINYAQPQEYPLTKLLTLTDLGVSAVTGTIAQKAFPSLQAYNVNGIYKGDGTTPAANVGIYFYKSATPSLTEPAIGVAVASIQGSGAAALGSDNVKVTAGSSNMPTPIFTVSGTLGTSPSGDPTKGKTPDSSGNSSDSKGKTRVWMWVGIGIGIIALIAIIGFVIYYHKKSKAKLSPPQYGPNPQLNSIQSLQSFAQQ
jgi:hypothetical protein